MPIYALADADFQNHPALRAPHLKQKGNWGLPVTAHYSLLTAHYSLLTAHCRDAPWHVSTCPLSVA